jgi:hypothetical protein
MRQVVSFSLVFSKIAKSATQITKSINEKAKNEIILNQTSGIKKFHFWLNDNIQI